MDGTVFRKPITLGNVPPKVKSWKKPITVARHAFGDIYRDQEMVVQAPGTVELVYTPRRRGAPQRLLVNDFQGGGVAMGMFNTDASIRSFARACFTYALGGADQPLVRHQGHHLQEVPRPLPGALPGGRRTRAGRSWRRPGSPTPTS